MPYDVDDDGVRTDIVHWSTCPNADSHRPKPADVVVDRQRQAKINRATAMLNNPKLPADFDSPDNVNDLDGAALDALIKALADVLNKPATPPADTQHADDLPF